MINELSGKYIDGMYGKYIEFEMPEGKTEIQSVTFASNVVAAKKFNADGTKGRIVIGEVGESLDLAEIKVTIDGTEYTINYQ